jgi:hypothetical protein
MEVVDQTSIEKTYRTRCAVVGGTGGRAVLDCSKVNRVGESDVEAAKKFRGSIGNSLCVGPRDEDRAHYSTSNL